MIEQQCSHVWTWRPGWTRNICQKCGESEPLKELAAADPLRAEPYDALRKRVAELEGLFSYVGVETHKWLDPECGHEGCQSLMLKARAEQAEAQLNQACGREHDAKERCAELEKQCAELSGELEAVGIECAEAKARIAELEEANSEIAVEALRDHRELHACAERAEARVASGLSWGGFNLFGDSKSIAEAKRLLHEAGRAEQMVVLIKDERARAERAEAERDAAKAHVVDLEEIVKGVHFLRKQAEAERDVITEWVIMIENRLECAVQGDEICKGCVEVAYSYAKEARAALNPSLAGEKS